jgi:hypothetical protein
MEEATGFEPVSSVIAEYDPTSRYRRVFIQEYFRLGPRFPRTPFWGLSNLIDCSGMVADSRRVIMNYA